MLASQLSILTFVSDVLLVGALSYILITWWKAPSFGAWVSQAADIDAILKKAVREAGAATTILSERLTADKTSIERILIEVEEAKEKLTRLLATSEAVERGHGVEVSETRTTTRKARQAKQPVEDLVQEEVEQDTTDDHYESPTYEEESSAPSPNRGKRVNIFGEEINEEESLPLNKRIEITSTPTYAKNAYSKAMSAQSRTAQTYSAAPKKSVATKAVEETADEGHELKAKGFEETIAEAERLIKRGLPIKSVADNTKMAEEDVKMLSKAISDALKQDMTAEQERNTLPDDDQSELDKIIEANKEAHAKILNSKDIDARLGVLGKGTPKSGRFNATV